MMYKDIRQPNREKENKRITIEFIVEDRTWFATASGMRIFNVCPFVDKNRIVKKKKTNIFKKCE